MPLNKVVEAFADQVAWYQCFENRLWKRILHCIELLLIAIFGLITAAVLGIYGNGSGFQPVLILFTSILSLAPVSLVPVFFSGNIFKRWHIQVITLGLGCGMGVSIIASFTILELQFLKS